MRCSTLFLASLPIALAQDVLINNILVPTTARVGDSTTFNADIKGTGSNIVDSIVSSMELMFGESNAAGNNVADIVLTNRDQLTTAYIFPRSLIPGPYHVRMNATVNTTSNGALQQLTANSPTIQITSGSFTCATPSPYPNMTSPNSPSFHSFILENPQPGDVETVSTDGKNAGSIVLSWAFRDNKNQFGAGIDKFSIEFMLQDSKGNLNVAGTVPSPDPEKGSELFTFPQTNIVPGVYHIRINYTNVFQDGAVQAGGAVSFLTQEFFIAGDKSDCEGVPAKGSSSTPTSGGQSNSPTSGGQSPSTPSSGTNTGGNGGGSTGSHSGSVVVQPLLWPISLLLASAILPML